MVMFPNGGMSDGNGSMQPIEDGYAPKFKIRKVSATRKFPPMCGLEYQHCRVEPEETAAVSGGENVALNLDFNAGAVAGSGLQNQPVGGGTSTEQTAAGSGCENVALLVEPEETAAVSGGENVALNLDFNAGAVTRSGLQNQPDGGGTSTEDNGVHILPLEAWENHLTFQADTSENLVNSESWNNLFNGDTSAAAAAIDLDTIDFEMEFGVEAQSHEVVGSPVEEEGNESVDMMVERALKGFGLDMDEGPNRMVEVKRVEIESVKEEKGNNIEVQPSVERLVYGEDEALAKSTDEDGGKKIPSEGGFVIHEEASALSSKKRFRKRRVSAKRDFPKYCGLDANVPPDEEDSIGSIDTWPPGDHAMVHALPVRGNGPDSDGLTAGGSASTVKPGWRGKSIAKKTASNANAQRLLLIKLSKSPTKQPADTPYDKVLRDEGKNSEDEAPRKQGKQSSSFEVGVLNSGCPSSSNGDARSRVRDVLRTYQTVCRKLLQGEESRFEEGSKTKEKIKRIDLEAVKILKSRGKEVNTEPHHFVGAVPGVEVGDEFLYRVELAIVGIHRVYQGGIDCATLDGRKIAISIVASGGYDDDLGDPNVLIYSGQGGNPGKGKQPEDQKLERGNLALFNSKTLKNPVRVVRGTKENDQNRSKIVTKYVYDGLYTVEDHWKETGEHGKLVYMFKLTRNQGQKEVAWKEFKASKKTARVRHGVCVDDVAQKKEFYPIGVVNTVDDEKPTAFNYINKVMYHKPPLHLQPGKGCSCSGKCSGPRCSCAIKNGGEIPYNRNGAIVETKAIVYECGPHCNCPPSCYNRVSQSGIKLPLEVFKTDKRGWGVRALSSISSGSFICEYTGEILDDKEAENRTNDEYLFDIGEKDSESDTETGGEGGSYTIDALRFGNVGRFINHSCSPNLYAQNVLYDHGDKRIPHIMLFAAENIPPLQELAYDYNYRLGGVHDSNGNVKVKECRCGATGCTGRMY